MAHRFTNVKANPGDLAKVMMGVREAARREEVSITQLLEDEDPTYEYGPKDRAPGLDAFARVLREMGIRTRNVPELGIFSSPLEAFGASEESKVAFGEWVQRLQRQVQAGPRQAMEKQRAFVMEQAAQQRAFYESQDQLIGTPLFPYTFDPTPYFLQIAPAVPIAEVIAKTTPITGAGYQAYFLTDSTPQKQFVRITEASDIPDVKLTGSQHIIKVHKFGRGLSVSYEFLRRVQIDILALHIQRMMVQTEVDKLAAIIDIAVNGDSSGSSNAATVYTLSSLDASVVSPTGAASLTLRGYLNFKAKFRNPYQITTMLAQQDGVVATQMLSTGSANIPLLVLQNQGNQPYGGFVPINNELGDAVRIGLTDAAPTNKLLAFDRRFALEQIVEQGSDITESVRWIQNQTQKLVMTYSENYAIIDQNAVKILDMAS